MNFLSKFLKYLYDIFKDAISPNTKFERMVIFDDCRFLVMFRNEQITFIYKSQTAYFHYFNLTTKEPTSVFFLPFIESISEFLDFMNFIHARHEDVLLYSPDAICEFTKMANFLWLKKRPSKLFTTNVIQYLMNGVNTLLNPKLSLIFGLEFNGIINFFNSILANYDHGFSFKNCNGVLISEFNNIPISEPIFWLTPMPFPAQKLYISLNLNAYIKRKAPFDILEILSIFIVVFSIKEYFIMDPKMHYLYDSLELNIQKTHTLIQKLTWFN